MKQGPPSYPEAPRLEAERKDPPLSPLWPSARSRPGVLHQRKEAQCDAWNLFRIVQNRNDFYKDLHHLKINTAKSSLCLPKQKLGWTPAHCQGHWGEYLGPRLCPFLPTLSFSTSHNMPASPLQLKMDRKAPKHTPAPLCLALCCRGLKQGTHPCSKNCATSPRGAGHGHLCGWPRGLSFPPMASSLPAASCQWLPSGSRSPGSGTTAPFHWRSLIPAEGTLGQSASPLRRPSPSHGHLCCRATSSGLGSLCYWQVGQPGRSLELRTSQGLRGGEGRERFRPPSMPPVGLTVIASSHGWEKCVLHVMETLTLSLWRKAQEPGMSIWPKRACKRCFPSPPPLFGGVSPRIPPPNGKITQVQESSGTRLRKWWQKSIKNVSQKVSHL